jgi:ATP-dependent exoDNAse (exonuclease V) beta subunit
MIASRHEMMLASAGTGKTYALTNRFISLLAQGARPERIVALTFTRKAAGEFFDEILTKLAAAASSPARARMLADDLELADAAPARFQGLLRELVDAIPRLRLGTLDSFFAQIVRAFPLELGLAGSFETLEAHGARLERSRVLRRMFVRAAGGLDAAQREFIEAFKRATFGREEKRFGPRLDAFLDDHQEVLLGAPESAAWANPARIWPQGSPWAGAPADPAPALRTLRDWLATAEATDGQRGWWESFLAAAEGWTPGANLTNELTRILRKALEALPELSAGAWSQKISRRPQELTAAAALALRDLALYIAGGEVRRRLETTRGVHAVLSQYEGAYHDTVRRSGKLTFGDVQRLLQQVRLGSGPGDAEAAAGRLAIDYRLDGGIDHWLLDEFQDTSPGQWSILSNLVDEVVQDSAGVRSFFCVGDVKQAIYTWREGEPRLFREVFNHYNAAAPGTIVEGFLDQSRRSGPALIELVNGVFGNAKALEDLFPGPASALWNAEWRTHLTAVPERIGQAALLHAADAGARRQLTLELIRELAPLGRGLTCAVLVQTNEAAAELADFLRAHGDLPAIAEADLQVCCDNPVGSALLALVQAAAHPGDRLAWELLRMGPLGADVARLGHDRLSQEVLGGLHREGFARTLSLWLRRLEPALQPGDRFSRERTRQLVHAAEAFDATGSRDPGEFVEFMERHTAREPEGAEVIRVMTIHKSKGLGFDLVLVPDLEGQTLMQRREGLAVQKRPDHSVDWILDLPPGFICDHDPALSAHVRESEGAACYEQLALLYVALTRAKHGLYVITKPPGTSKSANFPRLLASTLGTAAGPISVGSLSATGSWSRGDPEWARKLKGRFEAPATVPAPPLLPRSAARAASRLNARRPSDEPTGRLPAERLFALAGGREAEHGAQVHALLKTVGWADAAQRSRLASGWAAGGGPGAEAAACLLNPELARVWERPMAAAEVWLERAFDVVLDGDWVSGKFDRVILERDAAGCPSAATLFDFKTDRVEAGTDLLAAAARHAGQLAWYRRAIQALTGLPSAAVAGEVVFTRICQRVRLPAD